MDTSREETVPTYEVIISEEAEAEQKAIFHYLFARSPDFAEVVRDGLASAIISLPNFPGPLAWSIDNEATDLYGFEVRHVSYSGTRKSRLKTPYRILFTLIPPADPDHETVIHMLRILRGSRPLQTEEQS